MLIMLAAGDDENVAAIACYDIGEFVRRYPNGRAIAKRLGAKDIVMQLIENENEELRRHALLCVSKMMVLNWEVRLIQDMKGANVSCGDESFTCRCPSPHSLLLSSLRRQYDKITALLLTRRGRSAA